MGLITQAEEITRSITPNFPLDYADVYPIVFYYLQECYVTNIKYDCNEMYKRLEAYTMREG